MLSKSMAEKSKKSPKRLQVDASVALTVMELALTVSQLLLPCTGQRSAPTPVRASLKRTCTSSATMEVSAHSSVPLW